MRPVLFNIGSIPVHSYYVLWTLGLWTALFWTRSRAVNFYFVDEGKLHGVLVWSFIAMLLGARLGGYFDNWSVYASDPKRLLNLLEGGMSSVPAALACGFTGIYLCKKKSIEVWRLADAASIPTMACIAIGRIGCFLNGCCHGKETSCVFAMSFPGKEGLMHPTQLYYSFGAGAIGFFLFLLEKRLGKGDRKVKSAVLWPMLMVLYGSERFFLDFLRVGDRLGPFKLGQALGILVAVSGAFWLFKSLMSRENQG